MGSSRNSFRFAALTVEKCSGGDGGFRSKGRWLMNYRFGRGCIILLIVCALSVIAPMAQAKTCDECPQGGGCIVNNPSSDGCNFCTCGVYCQDEQWYQSDNCYCTLAYCPHDTKIGNPYGEGQ